MFKNNILIFIYGGANGWWAGGLCAHVHQPAGSEGKTTWPWPLWSLGDLQHSARGYVEPEPAQQPDVQQAGQQQQLLVFQEKNIFFTLYDVTIFFWYLLLFLTLKGTALGLLDPH